MKHTLLIAAIAAVNVLASCNNAGPAGNDMPKKDSTAMMAGSKQDRNKKKIMLCMEGINAHDVDKVFITPAEKFTEYQDGSMSPIKGDSAKQMLAGYLNAFPDLKAEHSIYFADGDHVVVISDYSMTFKNDMGPVKATGKSVQFKDADIFTLDDDGNITSHRNIYPSAALFMQLGVDMAKMNAMMEKEKNKMGKK